MKIIEIKKQDKLYPDYLRMLEKPPETLYCAGNTELLGKTGIAVVGSRKCSEYGKQIAMRIGKAAAGNEVVVISGMAKGIDNFAHLGALNHQGMTIAVLGCGVDFCYPKENRKLYERIRQEGLLLSQFPPGCEPRPYQFPQRNAIIAALAEAVAVVEAGTNSGALITAEQAALLGKTVFSVPGNITSPYSLGTNKLILDGALPIAVIDDIFSGIGLKPKGGQDEVKELGADERSVYQVIREAGEVSVDEICRKLDKNVIFVNGILCILEMKGLVGYNFGKVFQLK